MPAPAVSARRRLRGPQRRAQLLECAAQLIVDEGIEAVTMERVAAVADVSKPVVYAHFANADEVVEAIARQEFDRLDAQVVRGLSATTSFEDRLDALMAPYLNAFLAPSSLFRRLTAHRVESRDESEAAGRVQSVLMFLADEILREFDLPKRDAGLAAAALYGAFETISVYAVATRARRADVDRVMRAIVVGGLKDLVIRRR